MALNSLVSCTLLRDLLLLESSVAGVGAKWTAVIVIDRLIYLVAAFLRDLVATIERGTRLHLVHILN